MTHEYALKRPFDLVLSFLLLLPCTVLIVILAGVIRFEDRHPALFVQNRVGRNQQVFRLYKLRTMVLGTGDRGTHEVPTSSVTRIGRFLRRTRLDELPQLFNILKGDMSFVGPRPCLPSQKEVIGAREPRDVFLLRPGLTGPAQLQGLSMSQPLQLAKADSAYIDKQSLRADLGYLLKTLGIALPFSRGK